MKTENLQIIGLAGNELVIREGKANDVFVPKPLKLTGNIDTVFRYLEKQKSSLPRIDSPSTDTVYNANIEIDRENMIIKLYVDPKGQSPDSIWAKLEYHEDFVKFGINSGEQLPPSDLAERIKMWRSCFKEREVAMKLVKELKSFKAKVDKQLEVTKDDRANYTLHKSQAVESNLPENFIINVPIFKGQPKESFEVEININADSFACSLISPEANDYISEHKDRIIDEQIKAIQEICPDLCIIEV